MKNSPECTARAAGGNGRLDWAAEEYYRFTMDDQDPTVRHEKSARRFAARLDGEIAYLSYTDNGTGVLDYAHVYVPPAFRGQGIASKITRVALQYAANNNISIVPTCPFVRDYIHEHPEYRSLTTGR